MLTRWRKNMNFHPLFAFLCFLRLPDWGDVYRHWLHLLDTGQVSAWGLLARGGSPVTCQRLLDTEQTLATQHFHPSSHRQLVLSALLYSPRSSRLHPRPSSPLTATSSPQNTEQLSCEQHLDSAGVSGGGLLLQGSLLDLHVDVSQAQLQQHNLRCQESNCPGLLSRRDAGYCPIVPEWQKIHLTSCLWGEQQEVQQWDGKSSGTNADKLPFSRPIHFWVWSNLAAEEGAKELRISGS